MSVEVLKIINTIIRLGIEYAFYVAPYFMM